jgi:hypothetical protein
MVCEMNFSETWRKSSYSANGTECIEVARKSSGSIVVRDSMDTSGPRLAFSLVKWEEFIHQIK